MRTYICIYIYIYIYTHTHTQMLHTIVFWLSYLWIVKWSQLMKKFVPWKAWGINLLFFCITSIDETAHAYLLNNKIQQENGKKLTKKALVGFCITCVVFGKPHKMVMNIYNDELLHQEKLLFQRKCLCAWPHRHTSQNYNGITAGIMLNYLRILVLPLW